MKIDQLKQIKAALDELAKTPTSLALVIARNLSKINSVVKHADNDFTEAQKMLFEKDEKGDPINYVGDQFANIVTEDGKEVLFTKETKLLPGQTVVHKYTDIEAAKKIKEEYVNEEHDIELNTFNQSVLDQAIESGAISASVLVPLIGNMIPETE